MAEDRLAPAAERGRCTIEDRVVEKIATIAAGEVDGTTARGAGWDRVLNRGLPKADATVAGERVRVQIEVAATWPTPLCEVTSRVRDNVSERIASLLGLTVDAVDVKAADIVRPATWEARVR